MSEQYCTKCYTHEDACECAGTEHHVDAGYCDYCGSIGSEELDFDVESLCCSDCHSEWEEEQEAEEEED